MGTNSDTRILILIHYEYITSLSWIQTKKLRNVLIHFKCITSSSKGTNFPHKAVAIHQSFFENPANYIFGTDTTVSFILLNCTYIHFEWDINWTTVSVTFDWTLFVCIFNSYLCIFNLSNHTILTNWSVQFTFNVIRSLIEYFLWNKRFDLLQ